MSEKISRRGFVKAGAVVGAGAALLPSSVVAQVGSLGVARWGMIIDLGRCYGCNACAVACKAEFDVRLGVFKSGVIENEHGAFPGTKRDFLPWLCNHCSNPTCVDVCPAEAIEKTFNGVKYEAKATYQRPDGAVLYDVDRCLGCHACVKACPYKARYVDPSLKAGAMPNNKAIGKCTYCMHRVENGIEPSCANTCPAGARVFGDLNDPNSEIGKLAAATKGKTGVIHDDFGTSPNVFYLGYVSETYDNGEDIRNEAPAESGQTRG
ncbi:MAG: 4Fe-4S dicluster domain-containing protein [bacterium]|nr:4Fe-4S dicluster domain-containing protein [bacterium]